MNRTIFTGLFLFGSLLLPIPPAHAAGRSPAQRSYIGIVYRELGSRIVGLGGYDNEDFVQFVQVWPPNQYDHVVGGFRSRRTIRLATAPNGTFLLTMRSASGMDIYRYKPWLNKVTSSWKIRGVDLASNAANSFQMGQPGRVWMICVARRNRLCLSCIGLDHSRVVGRFNLPAGVVGGLFWPLGRGALLVTTDQYGHRPQRYSLFYVTPHGEGRRVNIPRRLARFPIFGTVVQKKVLVGVNINWKFVRADIGSKGRIKPVVIRRLAVNPRKLSGQPEHFFNLRHNRAVVTALGDWNEKTEDYLHQYLFLISEKSGKLIRTVVLPASWQPIFASGGKVFALDGGMVYAFNSQLHQYVAARGIRPSPQAVQGR